MIISLSPVLICSVFYCVTMPHCIHFKNQYEVVIFHNVLFPIFVFYTDVSDDLKYVFKELIKELHVVNSSHFELYVKIYFVV